MHETDDGRVRPRGAPPDGMDDAWLEKLTGQRRKGEKPV
jgi:hypothetical protein